MITNNYSTGCLAYYTDMSQPVYVPRKNYASYATMNINDIIESGFITVISLPSPGHHLDIYISIEPSESILYLLYSY